MCKYLQLNARTSSHNLTICDSYISPRFIWPMRKQLWLNARSSSHNLTISACHTSFCLVFGIVRLVHLGRAFHNFLWVHPQLNIFNCNLPSPLSDLPIAHNSLALLPGGSVPPLQASSVCVNSECHHILVERLMDRCMCRFSNLNLQTLPSWIFWRPP